MKQINLNPRQMTIAASILPRGDYARSVVNRGHIPGVLSGAELQGRARSYGGWYARKRAEVIRNLARLGIESRLVLINSRQCRVWVNTDGERVELTVED